MTFEQKISFSDEQEQLLEIATNFCREKSTIAHVRDQMTEQTGYDPALWREMAELGWLGVALPEKFGGSDLSLGEVVTIMEPMGRYLFATPFLSTTLAAQALLTGGTDAQKEAWLPKIAEGAIASLALSELHGDWDLTNLTATATQDGDNLVLAGTKTFVSYASDAEVIAVSVSNNGTPAVVLVERDDLPSGAMVREENIDETQRTYRLTLDGITVPAVNLFDASKTTACFEHIHLVANLLHGAELCGGAAGVLDYTLEYLTTRKQFDRLIGSYQSLKHTMADILLDLEASRSHLYFAAGCFGKDQREGEIAVRMTKAQASETLAFAADRAIQFHGGFGFTYECDAQLYRRRAFWGASCHGDAAYHRKRLGDLMLAR